jgi:uncharacterized membrane protein YedE/YeeE
MRPARIITAFGFGLIFGIGLILSGMADPDRVKGFLDVAGQWNPSLALVMGGAIAVAAPAFYLARGRQKALLGDPIGIPANRTIDAKLLAGAAIFGLGWGLSGICPGPSLVLLGYGAASAAVFVIALILGIRLVDWFGHKTVQLQLKTDG